MDDTRLELVTSRTSSGCATSCANRPLLNQRVVFYNSERVLSSIFLFNSTLDDSHHLKRERFFPSAGGTKPIFISG